MTIQSDIVKMVPLTGSDRVLTRGFTIGKK